MLKNRVGGKLCTFLSVHTTHDHPKDGPARLSAPSEQSHPKSGLYIVIAYILIILLLSLSQIISAHAQPPKPGLRPGDTVPDITLSGIHNYPATTARLSGFHGKLLILDFWATWCAPCVAMIPKTEHLQKQFYGRVQFVAVTYQSPKEVQPFLARLEKQQHARFTVPQLTADTTLSKLFPHTFLPHYVWIGPEGTVKAITGYEAVTAGNITNMLSAGSIASKEKKDVSIPFDRSRPFLINGNGGAGENLLWHSLLSGYTEGLGAGFSFNTAEGKITARNNSLQALYFIALGGGTTFYDRRRSMLLVNDPSPFRSAAAGQSYDDWKKDHLYCYELIAPKEQAANVFTLMLDDLHRYFPQYRVAVEKHLRRCLVLRRTTKEDRLAARDQAGPPYQQFDATGFTVRNTPLPALVTRLDMLYLRSPYPLVDDTGYTGPVDIAVEAPLSNIPALNRALKAYGLELAEEERQTDMVVFRDTQ